MPSLREVDPEASELIRLETERQSSKLVLIASENFVSEAVLEAQGSILTNKYAEGYPNRRYYGGCEFCDRIEELAMSRAKKLFGADHVNVQPHSGTQANMAVFFSVLEPGDTILGMKRSHGGHLSHGSSVNFSGKLYQVATYGVNAETNQIDHDELESIALACRPKIIISGASSYPRIIDFKRIGEIARKVGAYHMADIAHIAGLVATGLHPSPVPHADFITTTTHKTLRGPRGGMVMCTKEFAQKIDACVFPGIQGGPLMHIIAAKAVALQEAFSPAFLEYQKQILKNALTLCSELQARGYSFISGGTDNHLMLMDLRKHDFTGKMAEDALDEAGIAINKNEIPFDTRGPQVTSGIRIGVQAVTSMGMKEAEMKEISRLISDVLSNIHDTSTRKRVREAVHHLCSRFPLYQKRLNEYVKV
jgi:glycine hydroxymethyltransferase